MREARRARACVRRTGCVDSRRPRLRQKRILSRNTNSGKEKSSPPDGARALEIPKEDRYTIPFFKVLPWTISAAHREIKCMDLRRVENLTGAHCKLVLFAVKLFKVKCIIVTVEFERPVDRSITGLSWPDHSPWESACIRVKFMKKHQSFKKLSIRRIFRRLTSESHHLSTQSFPTQTNS